MQKDSRWVWGTLIVAPLIAFAGCEGAVEAEADELAIDAEYGKPLLGAEIDTGKADTHDGKAGPQTWGLARSSAVWTVTGRWYHVTDEAGIAWPASSGLTWDEKYSAWVQSLPKTTADNGYVTFELKTPWGKSLPAPSLECAETAMFLRATFASWYHLPFFMAAWHPTHGRIYYGHFGIVNSNGQRLSGYPAFTTKYKDYTDDFAGKTDEEIVQSWPRDDSLRSKYLTSMKDDENPFLGEGAYAGAYFDEIFLNKRAGYFMLRLLTNFGSMHIADADRNTFNAKTDAVRAGDIILQRWQRSGIGHTLVVKSTERFEDGHLEADAVFGSMPRIQPHWYGTDMAKSYFTSVMSGGPGENSEGDKYSHLGGGLKRWRTPVEKSGRWYNIVPIKDRDIYISSTDYGTLAERTTRFEEILGSLTPEQTKAVLLEQIAMARANLEERPASCANRARREEAFDKLYRLDEEHFGKSRTDTDREHRTLADYVFAELVYEQSKTCCWNSSTHAMYEVVMDYNRSRVYDEATGTCNAPVVFMARDGAYDVFEAHAATLDRADEWVDWSEDEACAARNVQNDSEATHAWTPLCDIATAVLDLEPETPTSGCGTLTWDGECAGDTVRWCQDDRVETYECPGGTSCRWIDSYGYYWCQ